jgi:predicted transcriptional regulator
LDEFQLKAIGEGIEQIKNGNFLTNDKLNNEMETWLNEK